MKKKIKSKKKSTVNNKKSRSQSHTIEMKSIHRMIWVIKQFRLLNMLKKKILQHEPVVEKKSFFKDLLHALYPKQKKI